MNRRDALRSLLTLPAVGTVAVAQVKPTATNGEQIVVRYRVLSRPFTLPSGNGTVSIPLWFGPERFHVHKAVDSGAKDEHGRRIFS